MASRYAPDKGTKNLSFSLYYLPHKGAYILNIDHSTLSDHFTTTMVDIYPYGYCLLIIVPSEDEPSICIYSWFYSSENKP